MLVCDRQRARLGSQHRHHCSWFWKADPARLSKQRTKSRMKGLFSAGLIRLDGVADEWSDFTGKTSWHDDQSHLRSPW